MFLGRQLVKIDASFPTMPRHLMFTSLWQDNCIDAEDISILSQLRSRGNDVRLGVVDVNYMLGGLPRTKSSFMLWLVDFLECAYQPFVCTECICLDLYNGAL